MRCTFRTRGEAVFYGPKIGINIVDSAGREWQCTTIQFDFTLPKRFNISYVGTDGREHEVVMIHRALLGAIERFFAILTEHSKGNFPVWLAPVQVKVLPVSIEYAEKVHMKLLAYGIRSKCDSSTSTISYRIRQAEMQKIPYIIVCGRREAESKKIAVRRHRLGNLGSFTMQEFLKRITKDLAQGEAPSAYIN